MSPRTILISSFHVLVSRNIIATPFIGRLLERGWRVVLVMPEKKCDYFEKTFGRPGVTVVGIPNRLDRRDDLFRDLAMAAIRTRSLLIMRRRGMGLERPLAHKLLSFAPLIRRAIPFLYRLAMPRHSFHDLFVSVSPSLFLSTDIFSSNDCRLALEARAHGIPVVGMVRSWDNLTAKGGFRVIPDLLTVPGSTPAEEAARIHSISSRIMRVVGVPHYDRYTRALLPPRAEALEALGLPLGVRYAVYAPIGDRIVKIGDRVWEHSLDREMIALLDRTLPADMHLVVRCPPTDTLSLDRSVFSARVRFQDPGVRFGDGVRGVRASEMSREDDDLLRVTLGYAAFLVNPFSSLCIDAALFDTPVIMPAFDFEKVSYWESAERFVEFDHFLPLLATGGIRVVRSPAELGEAIAEYLAYPEHDRVGRGEIVRVEHAPARGGAVERLGAVVDEVVAG